VEEDTIEIPSKPKSLLYYERYMLVIGVIGQLVFYAQGFKIFLTKSANDVSILGFLAGLISVASWLIYGILIKNRVLVIVNILAVVGALLVVIGILVHR
jgi:MtN3 and saliva related transmembrane protein